MKDFLAVFKSTNFLTSLVTLFLSGFMLAGANIPPDAGAEVVEAIGSGNYVKILFAIGINLVNPLFHFFKAKPEKWWTSFGSVNFWTNAATVVLSIFVLNGIEIPDGTASEIVGSIIGKNWVYLGSIFIINIINPVIHFFRPSKNPPPEPLLSENQSHRAGVINSFTGI